MSKYYKFAIKWESRVYHVIPYDSKNLNYSWVRDCRSKCGRTFWGEEIYDRLPAGKRLCKRCARAMKKGA